MIGAFIGTFNPITTGHLLLAQGILNEGLAERVVFVPVSDAYDKETLQVRAQLRLAMIEVAIADHPDLAVNDIEIRTYQQSGHQNKSIETLADLQKQYQKPIGMIIGADNLAGLSHWYQAEALVARHPLILIPRNGMDVEEKIHNDAWLRQHVQQYAVVKQGLNGLSSRQIRQWVSQGKSVRYFVAEAVADMIREQGLYREESR